MMMNSIVLKGVRILKEPKVVRRATIRFAEKSDGSEKKVETMERHFEICSLVGTLSSDGGSHLHTVLSTEDGSTVGGHVVGDMEVFTTAEIVIGSSNKTVFTREFDQATGYDELMVTENIC